MLKLPKKSVPLQNENNNIKYFNTMRNFRLMMVLTVAAMTTVSCGSKTEKQETPKVPVLYYSQTSKTKVVAEEIASRLCTSRKSSPSLPTTAISIRPKSVVRSNIHIVISK